VNPPRVLLSFAAAYASLAQRLSAALRAAGLDVRHDPWDGGGGTPGLQRLANDVGGVDFVVPLLTPSDAAPTWIGEAWRTAVFDAARARGIDILPVLGDGPLDAVPDFLRASSYADLRGRDAPFEMRRLLQTMRERCGDGSIVLPDDDAIEAPSPLAVVAHPLVLELGAAWDVPPLGDDDIAFMVDGLFYELGVHFPPLELRTDPTLPPRGLRVLVNEVPECELEAVAGAVLVNEAADALARLGIAAQAARNPANGMPASWVATAQLPGLAGKNVITWNHRQFLVLTLSAVLRDKAADFMGVAEAQALLALIEPAFPRLVAQTVPDPVSPLMLTDVLRRLLAEGVCIRNLHNILMTLADRGRSESDPLLLTEYVRAGLRRQLSHQLGRGQKWLVVFLLDPEIESCVRAAITHTATGSYVNLAPAALAAILEAIHAAVRALPAGAQVPQILTTLDIRSSIRRLVAPSLPRLHVLSYHDLRPDIDIQPVGRITLQGFRARPGARVGDELLRD
jgi:type III secretion protein V